jgi:hypothetical protein
MSASKIFEWDDEFRMATDGKLSLGTYPKAIDSQTE